MWKKVLILFISLVGTFSVVYASQTVFELNAATSQSATTGVTARINLAPSGLSKVAASTGFKPGDKIAIQAGDNAWILLRKETYTDYMITGKEDCKLTMNQKTAVKTCVNPAINGWWAGTEKATDSMKQSLFWNGSTGNWDKLPDNVYGRDISGETIQYYYVRDKNQTGSGNFLNQFLSALSESNDTKLLTYRNLTNMHRVMTDTTLDVESGNTFAHINNNYPFNKEHLPNVFSLGVADFWYNNDIKYFPSYEAWGDLFVYLREKSTDTVNTIGGYTVSQKGVTPYTGNVLDNSTTPFSSKFVVNANTYLGLDNVVFSASSNVDSTESQITIPKDLENSKAIYIDSKSAHMIARILDTSMTISQSGLYQNGTNTEITKVNTTYKAGQNTSFDIMAQASKNSSAVSAFLFDKATGDVKYYFQNLGVATGGASRYAMNLQGIPVGKYQLAIINEQIPTTNAPTYSSHFTSVVDLDVVPPLTSLNYNVINASLNYGNVSADLGGVATTGGTAPYSYSIGPVETDSSSYQYFKIDMNRTISGKGNPVILDTTKITGGKLPVGTYKFQITVTDANGASLSKDVTFSVTKATPTISFVNPSTTNKLYTSGETFTETITHTNTDGNIKPSYSANNGIVSVSTNESGNAFISLNTTGLTGDVVITATLPASTNFNTVTATKTIHVYSGMNNFKFTPSKTPITITDTQNANYLIGQLSLDGGSPNYTYSITADPSGNAADHANASSFKINTTSPASSKTMGIYTTGQLTAGTYKVTFKVKDQNNQELYLPVTITVQTGEQTGFEFYDYETNEIITSGTKQIEYGTQNAKIIASGGSGNGAITYKFKDGEPTDVIDIDTSTGDIKDIKKTGSVVVEATKAGDGNYNSKTIEMTVEIIDGTQSIVFDSSIPFNKKFVLDNTIAIPAVLTRKDGSSGAITYAATTTDICTIDDPAVASVTMKKTGECIVTATNNDTYYKNASDTISIQLYAGVTGSLIQMIDPLNQGDADALGGSTNVIAKVTGLSGGDGTFTFTNYEVKKNSVSVKNLFSMDMTNGDMTPAQDLTYGTYDVEITVEDGQGEASTITGQINIGLETNSNFKIIQDSVVISEITSDYVTAQNSKITLSTQGRKGTGTIHYVLTQDSQKDPNKTDEAITVDESTGVITVHRAMTTNDLYKIYAYIEEDLTNGFAKQVTQSVPVQINQSSQSITFDASVPASLKYVLDKTFDVSAHLDRSDGDIAYSSTTPSVCIVEDSAQPIAKMLSSGICTIKAENKDDNYISATETKQITLYDGITAQFVQVVTPLKQGDASLDPASKTVIGKVSNLAGNQGDVEYSLKTKSGMVDVSYFEIDKYTGEVIAKETVPYGTYDLTITMVDATGVDNQVSIQGQIIVGLEENDNLKMTYKGTAVTQIADSYANVSGGMSVSVNGKKGSGQVHYYLKEDTHVKDPSKNKEAIVIHDDGTITVNRAMTAQDVYEIYAVVEQDMMNGYAAQTSNTVPIRITDSDMPEMNWLVDNVLKTDLHETYSPNKTIQLGVDNAPSGSTITYELITDENGEVDGVNVTDVILMESATGKATIQHANLSAQTGKVQIKAIVHCDGYADSELPPLNVQIDKAEQTNFKFAQAVYTMPYGTGSFTPSFLNAAPHDDGITYNNKLSCPDPYDVRVDASTPDTFTYNVTEPEGAMITIKARNLGNRDYKAKEATAILKVLGENESLFDVSVNPSPQIYYGESVTITPDLPESATISYAYESLDETILTQDETEPSMFHSQKVGTVQIKVTKTEAGAAEATVYVSVSVKPKEINIELDGPYEIKAGEALPSFSIKEFTSGTLVNGDTLPVPQITVAIQNTQTPGTYPITVTYPNDSVTSNYKITQILCDLTITQDVPEDNWYKIYKESDETKTQADLVKWYNEPLVIETIHSDYDGLSFNGINDWQSTLTIDEEGNNDIQIYFRKNASGAFSEVYTVHAKIDYTKPKVKSMTGTITNQDGLWKLIHDITFSTFFKPKTNVIFTVEDPQPVTREEVEVSGVAKVQYKVYLADKENDELKPLTTNGIISSNEIRDGKASITLNNEGDYYICANSVDFAGNAGDELCSFIRIKGMGSDSDGDGIPDLNIDLDDDGEPDLNITKEPNDDKPYMNIDTNGDGIADTNIDTDNDGEPDINIGIVHEWHPYIEVDINNDGTIDFKTGAEILWELNIDSDKDGKPDINVDVDKNGIADINIDTDNDFSKPEINIDNIGDGKPHINIDDNEDGKPDRNIVIFTKWEPEDDVKGNITYDTMYSLKAKDTLVHDETNIMIQSLPDHAFKPYDELEVDKKEPESFEAMIQDQLEENQKVAAVYELSILDETGSIHDYHDPMTIRIPKQEVGDEPTFYMKKASGEIKQIEAVLEDGYYTFVSDELGTIGVIETKDTSSDPVPEEPDKPSKPDPEKPDVPKPDDTKTPSGKEPEKPQTSVQGNYTNQLKVNASNTNGIGGADTGDQTNTMVYISTMIALLGTFAIVMSRKKTHK